MCDSSDCPDVPFENPTLWISNVEVDDNEDIVVEDGCDLPDNTMYLLGSDVLYNISDAVGGFQFNVDGSTVSAAAGGDAAAAGFTVCAGGSVVLGF